MSGFHLVGSRLSWLRPLIGLKSRPPTRTMKGTGKALITPNLHPFETPC